MAKLPDFTALGERRPVDVPRGVAQYRPTSGMEDVPSQVAAHSAGEFDQASQAAERAQEHQDTMVAEDAYNKLQEKRLSLEFDPEKGFRQVQGMGAMGQKFFQDNVGKLEEAQSEIGKDLSPSQATKFKQRASVAGLQYRSALLQHQSQEMNAFNDNTEANGVAIRLKNMSLNWGDDLAFATGVTEINGLLDARGMRKNLPPEQTAVEKAKAFDEAWATRIKAAMNNDPLRADAMFRSIEPELSANARLVLNHELRIAVLPVRAKSAANEIINPSAAEGLAAELEVGGEQTMNRRNVRAMLGTWEAQARARARRDYPNSPAAEDLYVNEVKGRVATMSAAQEGVEREAQGAVLSAAWGIGGGPKPLTVTDLTKDPAVREALGKVDVSAYTGIMAVLNHNQREANGEFVRSNPATVKDLHDRMFLDEGDPKKIRSVTELVPYFANGLNQQSYDWLRKELETARTPEGNAFLRDKNRFVDQAKRRMSAGIMGQLLAQTQPEVMSDAQFNFELAVDKRIDEVRKAGGDVRSVLFDPKSPDYILRPGYVETFLPKPNQAVGDKAKKIMEAEKARLPKIVSADDYDKLGNGLQYVDPNGIVRTKGGR